MNKSQIRIFIGILTESKKTKKPYSWVINIEVLYAKYPKFVLLKYFK